MMFAAGKWCALRRMSRKQLSAICAICCNAAGIIFASVKHLPQRRQSWRIEQ